MKTSNPFGIYIHIPFCKERCTYCDFLTYPHVPSFHAPYVEALIQEIRHPETKRRLDGRRVSSIFLGGGTPSLLPPKALLRIFETLRGEVSLEESCEISIEANPDTITPETAECFALCGINRVSLGVQSFSPRLLEAMGRTHHVDDVENAVRSLHKAGICNINFDLIEGYPQQTISDIEHDLAAVEKYAPTHISWYSLILEEKTLLHYQWKRGRIAMMDEDSEWRLTEKIRSGIQKLGYHRYEISNY
ncbi:MAG: radical SAM family heme chaperone HemW, partial [Peptoniphilaceae bacterium]|nr:radical SAM family heme chaperone HemW [Peptoniphilaceae bacterium]